MAGAAQRAPENRRNERRPVGRVAAAILREVWTIRLRRSGFQDLEGKSWELARRDHQSSWIHEGRKSAGFRPRQAFGAAYARVDETVPTLGIGELSSRYRRMEHLSSRFADATDQQIGVSLSDGVGVRTIKTQLGVGQGRVDRVARQLKAWMAEEESDDDGQE